MANDIFPYAYEGGGYYRQKGVPIGQKADMLHGMQAIEYVINKLNIEELIQNCLKIAHWLSSKSGDKGQANLNIQWNPTQPGWDVTMKWSNGQVAAYAHEQKLQDALIKIREQLIEKKKMIIAK